MAEEMLDGQRQGVDIPAHARAAYKGLLLKRLEEDSLLNRPSCAADNPVGQRTELKFSKHPHSTTPFPFSLLVSLRVVGLQVPVFLKAFIHYQTLPYDSGTKHPVNCYGDRQTLTSPSDSVVCLTRTAEARFLSDTTHSHHFFFLW